MIIRIFRIISLILALSLLALAVKGDRGAPLYFQSEKDGRVGGPFESSNNTSRYVLTEAIVNDQSVELSLEKARFASPDIVQNNHKLYSIFPPGISFIGAPFYMVGKWFGVSQLLTYLSTLLIAIVNVFLITFLGKKLGASMWTSLVGGMVFLFATNALPYALTYTQHHASTTFILLALIIALSRQTFLSNVLFGAIYGASILVDIPNALFLFPVLIYVFWRHLSTAVAQGKIQASLKLAVIGLMVGLLPMLGIVGWYNYQVSGSLRTVAQGLTRVNILDSGEIRPAASAQIDDPYQSRSVFDTRLQVNGLYILLFSNQRGWLVYSPIVLLGIIGLMVSSKKPEYRHATALSGVVVVLTIVSYSMFGDPWGGWSFGPRYLIPAAAILCAGISVAASRYGRKPIFVALFMAMAGYSIGVNTLGALTTNSLPPKGEAINLPQPIPYTYTYNKQFIDANKTSSLVYNIYFNRYLSARDFAILYWLLAFATISGLFAFTMREKETGGISL